RYTRAVAAELRRRHARGTFFLVGERLGYWRGALRAETGVGVLGDHTWTHAPLAMLGPRALRDEISRTRAAEFGRTGRPVLLFRPPYGVRTRAADARSEEHTSELQSRGHLVCRLLLEKKKTKTKKKWWIRETEYNI